MGTRPQRSRTGAGMSGRGESYATFQQRRGMLADAILAALHEYTEWCKDDDYNALSCLHRVVAHLERVEDVARQVPEEAPNA